VLADWPAFNPVVCKPRRVAEPAIPFVALAALRPAGAAVGDAFHWVEVDRARVQRKQRTVTLFTPLPDAAPPILSSDDELRLWALALPAYRLQHRSDAQQHLQELRSVNDASALSGVRRQLAVRIQQFRLHPPAPAWDGSHSFDTK